jgi:hypothetical protein
VVEIPDERLIDHALGLEDDPELEQELAHSEELRQRLRLLEADLHQIDTELHGVLPPAEEGWTDLSRERWRRLQPFLEAPAPRRSRSLRSRLLAPAIALIVVAALLVGVISMRDVGLRSAPTSAGDAAGAPEAASVPSALQKAVGGLAAGYGQVVVAQAGGAQAGRQPYEVVRVLKGPALTSFTVDLGSGAGVPEGSLQVVYLDPLSSPGTESQGQATLGSGATGETPSSSRQNGDYGAGGEPTVASPQPVTVDGKPALVQPLPSGIDPNTLTAP